MLKPPFVLMVGDDAALLLPPPGEKRPVPLFAPSHEDKDARPIVAALSGAKNAPIVLLADTLAQDYKTEMLPPVSFLDRAKIVARRLEAAFPKTPIKTALPRKNGSFLFASLDETGVLASWLDRLEKLETTADVIALLPVESADMTARLAPAAAQGWGLLLSHHKTGGFRQIITLNGELIFTRLTAPLPPETHPDNIAESLAQDIEATRAYLSRMGLTDETPLTLAAILPSAWHAAFAAHSFGTGSRLLFSPREAAARLHLALPALPDEPCADLIHALWVQTKGKRETALLRPRTRAARRERTIVRAGTALAGFAGLLAFLVLAGQGLSLGRIAADIKAIEKESVALETRLQNARTTLAAEAAPLEQLRKAVERKRLFSVRQKTPNDLAARIAAALPPEAKIVAFDWTPQKLMIDLFFKNHKNDEAPDEITRQEILRDFDNLAFLLKGALKDCSVEILRYPFPNLPNETLTNKAAAPARELPTASFLIRKEGKP